MFKKKTKKNLSITWKVVNYRCNDMQLKKAENSG